jgi:hypothetical protein
MNSNTLYIYMYIYITPMLSIGVDLVHTQLVQPARPHHPHHLTQPSMHQPADYISPTPSQGFHSHPPVLPTPCAAELSPDCASSAAGV